MSASTPAKNWTQEVANGGSYTFPSNAFYCQVQGSGTVVLKNEDGTTLTRHCSGGEILTGTFVSLTSTTATYIVLGNGSVPPASGAAATADLYQNAQSTQGLIWLPAPASFYLLTGAPLAIFSNGASAVPGSALVDSKGACIRWNNNSTLNGVLASYAIPPDCDITAAMTASVYASKTAATSADAVTFDLAGYAQVVGTADDGGATFSGTTSAMTGTATAKTVQVVTLAIAAANLVASPASYTLSLKPTNGTLETDDLCLFGVRIAYKKKLLTS